MGKQILELHAKVPVDVKEEDGNFIASCWPLDVHSQGESKEEAQESLKEALSLFLESCLERGTLEQVLRDSGFHLTQARDEGSAEEQETVDIPLPFETTGRPDGEPVPC